MFKCIWVSLWVSYWVSACGCEWVDEGKIHTSVWVCEWVGEWVCGGLGWLRNVWVSESVWVRCEWMSKRVRASECLSTSCGCKRFCVWVWWSSVCEYGWVNKWFWGGLWVDVAYTNEVNRRLSEWSWMSEWTVDWTRHPVAVKGDYHSYIPPPTQPPTYLSTSWFFVMWKAFLNSFTQNKNWMKYDRT